MLSQVGAARDQLCREPGEQILESLLCDVLQIVAISPSRTNQTQKDLWPKAIDEGANKQIGSTPLGAAG